MFEPYLIIPLGVQFILSVIEMSGNFRNHTVRHVRPGKIQISLRIRAVWSESSLSAIQTAKGVKFLQADNKDSNQTARLRRLIWVFVGRTCPKLHFLFFFCLKVCLIMYMLIAQF